MTGQCSICGVVLGNTKEGRDRLDARFLRHCEWEHPRELRFVPKSKMDMKRYPRCIFPKTRKKVCIMEVISG